jgi:hypothetical protein
MTRLLVLLLLAGCATTPITQGVDVPVYVKCVTTVPSVPDFEVRALRTDASEGEKFLAFARDTLKHFRYEGELSAALAGCL